MRWASLLFASCNCFHTLEYATELQTVVDQATNVNLASAEVTAKALKAVNAMSLGVKQFVRELDGSKDPPKLRAYFGYGGKARKGVEVLETISSMTDKLTLVLQKQEQAETNDAHESHELAATLSRTRQLAQDQQRKGAQLQASIGDLQKQLDAAKHTLLLKDQDLGKAREEINKQAQELQNSEEARGALVAENKHDEDALHRAQAALSKADVAISHLVTAKKSVEAKEQQLSRSLASSNASEVQRAETGSVEMLRTELAASAEATRKQEAIAAEAREHAAAKDKALAVANSELDRAAASRSMELDKAKAAVAHAEVQRDAAEQSARDEERALEEAKQAARSKENELEKRVSELNARAAQDRAAANAAAENQAEAVSAALQKALQQSKAETAAAREDAEMEARRADLAEQQLQHLRERMDEIESHEHTLASHEAQTTDGPIAYPTVTLPPSLSKHADESSAVVHPRVDSGTVSSIRAGATHSHAVPDSATEVKALRLSQKLRNWLNGTPIPAEPPSKATISTTMPAALTESEKLLMKAQQSLDE
mmetsp:Transcript_40249/g.96437  ORF Transcript_40249/g.96437 Transcript_40249/m.96437 type:complete len:544 (-) Transcript_40249:63-1694(-)